VLLSLAGAFFAADNINKIMPSAKNFLDNYYQHYNSQDFDYLYSALLDENFKSKVNAQKFKQIQQTVYEYRGQVVKRDELDHKLEYAKDGAHLYIKCKVTLEKGEMEDAFFLKKVNNYWVVENIQQRSDNTLGEAIGKIFQKNN